LTLSFKKINASLHSEDSIFSGCGINLSHSSLNSGLKVKNKLFTKLSDISEIFNKHFSTISYKLGQIFGRVIDADQFPLKTTETFCLTPVTEKFVYDQLLQLKPNKAIGLGKISSRLLKDGAEVIAPILAKIMNCSFNSESFPQNLSDRNAMSSSRSVNIGVPQGSIPGPLFFLIYINDLAEGLQNSKAALFADDTAIYCSATSAADLQLHLNRKAKIITSKFH
jgi:hypothetical protein